MQSITRERYACPVDSRSPLGELANLVKADAAAPFQARIADTYLEKTGITAEIYVCEPAQGAEAWPTGGGVQA